jgi:hypothetical protein
MNDNQRQLILLTIAVIVPLVLLGRKQTRLLLGWVCFTLMVQIFDTVLLTNLPAARVVGLICLPFALKQLREWMRHTAPRAFVLNFAYLTALALLFGFFFPWSDTTGLRPLTLTAQGKSIIYLVRLMSDFSLAIFIASEISQPGALWTAARTLSLGSALSVLAGFIDWAMGIDLYVMITGMGESLLQVQRVRGLAIEPRSLGQMCVYGMMVLLIGRQHITRWWSLLLLFNLAGLLLTYSTSSLVLFAAGLVTAMLFLHSRIRILAFITLILAVLAVGAAWVTLPKQFDNALATIQMRADPMYKLSGIAPGTFGQEIAYRLDVFDASALLFLLDNPIYALTGTGPGLVPLPATNYIPPGLYSLIWTVEIGINSPPAHGLLLEICNSGLPGLSLWLFQVFACLSALRFCERHTADLEQQQEFRFARAFFFIGAVCYLIQVSHVPVWSLMLGTGWAGIRQAKEFAQFRQSSPTHESEWMNDALPNSVVNQQS